MQGQRELQQRFQEMEDATFRPTIASSQRTCRGIGRAMRDPEGLSTRSKIARLRELRQEEELDGCTFHPQIDHRSEELMQERLGRINWSGNLHDALYEDALRRRERQVEAQRSLPPGVTFQPDIGENHCRHPNDATPEDFVTRLAYAKAYSEKWSEQQRHEEQQENEGVQDELRFQPRVGRGPLVERNSGRLPIGEFLYEGARAKAVQQAKREDEERAKSQPSTPRMSEASRQLFEESKLRRYRAVYDSLTQNDLAGSLCMSTACLEAVEWDPELEELLRPVLAYLRESRATLGFEDFAAVLDHERRSSAVPSAGAFSRRSGSKASDGVSSKQPGKGPLSQHSDSRSSSKGASRRTRGIPVHEQLYSKRDVRDTKLQEMRAQKEEKEHRECTFRPNLRPARSRPSSAGSIRGDTSAQAASARSVAGGRRDPDHRGSLPNGRGSVIGGTPRSLQSRGPPSALIHQISLHSGSQSASGNITPSLDPEEFEPSIGNFCREQIDQVEQAVAHCKSVVAHCKSVVAHCDTMAAGGGARAAW
mmetsp:Transcript_6073/g.15046  ORF Transcript_6073/g.15046 Transcript_6073/m.15046 type:complete len:536 (-) Transcript_6073:271-1878(-)